MDTFFGATDLPFSTRRMTWEQRKKIDVWPNGKRLAVLVYTALEEWMWDRLEPFPPSPVRTCTGELTPSLSSRSAVNYGFEIGLPRICELLDEYGLKITMWTNGNAAGQHRDMVRLAAERGQQIEGHGFSEGKPLSTMTRAQQYEDVRVTTEKLREVTGCQPRGWIGPGAMCTVDTIEAVAENGYRFHSDLQDDELPYFIDVGPHSLVEVPYRMVGNINDLWLFTTHYRSLKEGHRYLIESFDAAYEAAKKTPMIFVYGTHSYVSGRADYASVLGEFLSYVLGKEAAWLTTFADVADWWSRRFSAGYKV